MLPQPVGTYGSYLVDSARRIVRTRINNTQSVLIVDAEHYSVGWVLFRDGFWLDSSSSTTAAGAAIVHDASARLSRDLGRVISNTRLSKIVMDGAQSLHVAGKRVDFWPAIRDAAEAVVRTNVSILCHTVEGAARGGLDFVLVTGGAAGLFREALAHVFDGTPVVPVLDVIFANARGFHAYAGRQ